MQDIAVAADKAQQGRAIYEFDVVDENGNPLEDPESGLCIEDAYVKKSVGLRCLTPDEEIKAATMAGQNAMLLAYKLAMAALVEVDGRRLDKGEGEDETAWKQMGPPMRQLVMSAYGEIHNVGDVIEKKFLKSKRVKIG